MQVVELTAAGDATFFRLLATVTAFDAHSAATVSATATSASLERAPRPAAHRTPRPKRRRHLHDGCPDDPRILRRQGRARHSPAPAGASAPPWHAPSPAPEPGRVTPAGRDEATPCSRYAGEIESAGGRALVVPTDVSNPDAVARMESGETVATSSGDSMRPATTRRVAATAPRLGRRGPRSRASTPPLAVNLRGGLRRHAARDPRHAPRGGRGRAIVNMSSTAGERGGRWAVGAYVSDQARARGPHQGGRPRLHGRRSPTSTRWPRARS